MKTIIISILIIGFGVCFAQEKSQYQGAVIVYMSNHGTTEKVAGLIRDSLHEPSTIVNLKKVRNPDVSRCGLILIGGSMHAGRIQKEVKRFCRKNEELLLTKDIGLFVCCMFTGDKARQEFDNAFSEKMRNHARAKALMGYELLFDKMDPVTRKIMKKMSGQTSDVHKIDTDNIIRFVAEFNK